MLIGSNVHFANPANGVFAEIVQFASVASCLWRCVVKVYQRWDPGTSPSQQEVASRRTFPDKTVKLTELCAATGDVMTPGALAWDFHNTKQE